MDEPIPQRPLLQELQNRTFLLPKDWLSENTLPSHDPEQPLKFLKNPLITGTEVMFNFELDLSGQGKLEAYIFVTESDQINHYLLLFKLNDGRVYWSPYRSLTEYPRIWDRHFNFGPDYIDWLSIQKYANWILSGLGINPFVIDRNKENKTVFRQELKDGKYQNLCVKAAAVEIIEQNTNKGAASV